MGVTRDDSFREPGKSVVHTNKEPTEFVKATNGYGI
jgi:hypothetical protein